MNTPGFEDDKRTSLKRARGLGSAQSGVGHWWMQRVTAVALVALGIWFVCVTLSLVGSDYEAAREMLTRPWNAVLMIAFAVTAFWHMQLGVQVIIEDYVNTRWLEIVVMVLVKFIAVLLALACAVAVLRVALAS